MTSWRTRRSCLALMGTVALARTEAGHRLLAHDRQRRRVPVRGRHGRSGLADAAKGASGGVHRHRARAGRPARPAVQLQRAGLLRRSRCSVRSGTRSTPLRAASRSAPRPEAGRASPRCPPSQPPRVRADAEDPDQRAQIRVPGPLHRQLDAGVHRPAGRPGMEETIDGTATFARNPLIPPEAEAIIADPVRRRRAARSRGACPAPHTEAGCTTTYSGSGTDTASRTPSSTRA